MMLQGREALDSAEQQLPLLDGQHLHVTPEICNSLFQRLFALNLHTQLAREALETDTSEAGARLEFVTHHLEELLGELAPYCQKAK
jgi:Histidine kinase